MLCFSQRIYRHQVTKVLLRKGLESYSNGYVQAHYLRRTYPSLLLLSKVLLMVCLPSGLVVTESKEINATKADPINNGVKSMESDIAHIAKHKLRRTTKDSDLQ